MMRKTFILAALLATSLSASAFAQKSDAGTASGVGGTSGYGGPPAGTATTDAGEPGVADPNHLHSTMAKTTHRRPTVTGKAAAANGATNGTPGGDTGAAAGGGANGGGK